MDRPIMASHPSAWTRKSCPRLAALCAIQLCMRSADRGASCDSRTACPLITSRSRLFTVQAASPSAVREADCIPPLPLRDFSTSPCSTVAFPHIRSTAPPPAPSIAWKAIPFLVSAIAPSPRSTVRNVGTAAEALAPEADRRNATPNISCTALPILPTVSLAMRRQMHASDCRAHRVQTCNVGIHSDRYR